MYHHKNYDNIWGRLPVQDQTQNLALYFIGHETCVVNDGIHTDITAYGMTDDDEGYALITATGASLEVETRTVMHEIGRFYEILHHNGGDHSTTELKQINPKYSEFCIYGELNGNDVLTNLTLCGGCKDLITSQRTQYDHS